MILAVAGTVEAQRGGGVDRKPLPGDLLAAAQAFAIGAVVDPLQGRADPGDFRRAALFRRLGHRLTLHRIHPRQASDALLIERDGLPAFGTLLAQRFKLVAGSQQSRAGGFVVHGDRIGVDAAPVDCQRKTATQREARR